MAYIYRMKMRLISVGRPHEPSIKDAVDDFTHRISKYYPVEWLLLPPLKQASVLPEKEIKKKEAELILQQLSKDDYLVCLDEKGKTFTSEKLAGLLQALANESKKQVIFLIGGAFGVDETVLKRSDLVWSISTLTFPHQLVRLILAEQLYRACSILRNEKYHHA